MLMRVVNNAQPACVFPSSEVGEEAVPSGGAKLCQGMLPSLPVTKLDTSLNTILPSEEVPAAPAGRGPLLTEASSAGQPTFVWKAG